MLLLSLNCISLWLGFEQFLLVGSGMVCWCYEFVSQNVSIFFVSPSGFCELVLVSDGGASFGTSQIK